MIKQSKRLKVMIGFYDETGWHLLEDFEEDVTKIEIDKGLNVEENPLARNREHPVDYVATSGFLKLLYDIDYVYRK